MNKHSLKYWEEIALEKFTKGMRYGISYGMSPENLKKLGDEFDKLVLENKSFNLNTGESDSLELYENKLLLIL